MNKKLKHKNVCSSLPLNNGSSVTDGHVRLTFCHFPWALNGELSFTFSTRIKFIRPRFTEKLQHSMALKPTVFEVSNIGVGSDKMHQEAGLRSECMVSSRLLDFLWPRRGSRDVARRLALGLHRIDPWLSPMSSLKALSRVVVAIPGSHTLVIEVKLNISQRWIFSHDKTNRYPAWTRIPFRLAVSRLRARPM
jgi:hypothetical protein